MNWSGLWLQTQPQQFATLISTRLQPGVEWRREENRFSGFSSGVWLSSQTVETVCVGLLL